MLGRVSAMLACLLLAGGCAYVSKSEFDEHWDGDGDGWAIGEDCDDDDPLTYPYAPDVRGDGCDADCGTEVDSDGDDWPDDADCDPNNANTYPCSSSESEGDGQDSDCDGLDGVREDDCPRADPQQPLALSPAACAGGAL